MEDGGWMMDDGGMEHPQTEDGMEDGGWRTVTTVAGWRTPILRQPKSRGRRPCFEQAAAAARTTSR